MTRAEVVNLWVAFAACSLIACSGRSPASSDDASVPDAARESGDAPNNNGACMTAADCPAGSTCAFRFCPFACGGGECFPACADMPDSSDAPSEGCGLDGGHVRAIECQGFALFDAPVKWIGACDLQGTLCGIGGGCCGGLWMCAPGQTCGGGCSWPDGGLDAAPDAMCGGVGCSCLPCTTYDNTEIPLCNCTAS